MQITVTQRWHDTFTGGHVGVLLVNTIDNHKRPTPLDAHKQAVEAKLRETYAGFTRADLLQAYRTYYKRFNKTYHVQLQLESVVQKGKHLPTVNPLVDAYFAAELETLVLTAGHDADKLQGPIEIDASQEGDEMVRMNGKVQVLKPNDMLMRDAQATVCTIMYGQDQRTPITPATKRALFVAYAPAGVPRSAADAMFTELTHNIHLFAPAATVERSQLFTAGTQ